MGWSVMGGAARRAQNECRPRLLRKMHAGDFSNFLPLALFSFCSSIWFKNIPGSMRRRAFKCLFRQHFHPYPRSKAEPRLWPNCGFCYLGIQNGRKPCRPIFLSALPHLIATCRMVVLPATHSMRLSRQRKLRSQPRSVLSSRCWHALTPVSRKRREANKSFW